ncbi:hypothetical protein [Polyangium fumosum]|uniref:Uncharacterized protein n=1 Tax=Polyangium fumosum TaxID=889272 RepID=A0A4U1J0K4_9BACT|nr:hypothetical protein [Polyangium fumosum]TKD00546.1 hypothetical protein E8A74_34150 [Polyangium fumosum]TKD01073.1 hypothetical protein E8A74_32450 [Polyangium fumosum]
MMRKHRDMQMKDKKNGSRFTTRMRSQSHENVREIPLVDIVVPKRRARRLRDVTPLVESIGHVTVPAATSAEQQATTG